MAILFDDGSTEYMEANSAVAGALPISIAAWFNSNDATISQCVMSLQDKDVTNQFLALFISGNVSGDPVRFSVGGGGSGVNTDTTSGYSANTWHHACGVAASATSRASYIDGGSKGTGATSVTPSNIDRISIGRRGISSPDLYLSGMACEAAVWTAALSDAEVALLGLGFSPLFIRPESLVFYLPMFALGGAGSQADWMGGVSLTETNTPLTAAHPPNIIYPSWMTSGYGIPVVSSALAGTLRMTGGMTAIPLAANYKIFSSDVPRRTFVSR